MNMPHTTVEQCSDIEKLTQYMDTETQHLNKFTALHVAAQNGHLEVAHLLLYNDANIEAKNNYQLTPLDFATKKCHSEIVKLIQDAMPSTSLTNATKNQHFANARNF